MHDPLATLLADGVIDEVITRLKSGKEAEVWLVSSGGETVAAKVYKSRKNRSFKNDAAYKEGRGVRNTRTQRAMDRGSRFGQAAAEDAWKAKESDALFHLHARGVRVPRPILMHEGVLLMELVRDVHGRPAPRLVDSPVAREHAAALYADLRKQVISMLACGLIHGDLSPYNVLLGRDGPVVIDLPQVVDAAHNSQAERFFLRDLENIWRFCVSLAPELRGAEGDGREIWRAWVRRELSEDFVPTGRERDPVGSRAAALPGPHRQDKRPPPVPRGPRGGPAVPASHAQPRHSQNSRPSPRGSQRPAVAPRGPDPRSRPPSPEVVRVERLPQGGNRSPHSQASTGHRSPAAPPGAQSTGTPSQPRFRPPRKQGRRHWRGGR